jgi:hypothetical protein
MQPTQKTAEKQNKAQKKHERSTALSRPRVTTRATTAATLADRAKACVGLAESSAPARSSTQRNLVGNTHHFKAMLTNGQEQSVGTTGEFEIRVMFMATMEASQPALPTCSPVHLLQALQRPCAAYAKAKLKPKAAGAAAGQQTKWRRKAASTTSTATHNLQQITCHGIFCRPDCDARTTRKTMSTLRGRACCCA